MYGVGDDAASPPTPAVLTSRAKYAVRASIALAEHRGAERWTSAGALAEEADVPRKFLEAILTQLREQGLVESRRGPAGGHRLVARPEAVSVADIIRSIDGPLAMTPCASATQFRACDDCVEIDSCRISHVMRRARDAVAAVLEQCSLADLVALSPAASLTQLLEASA
jgi:Rrf2 family protein